MAGAIAQRERWAEKARLVRGAADRGAGQRFACAAGPDIGMRAAGRSSGSARQQPAHQALDTAIADRLDQYA
jgi:hypothetical protein